jgi:hypothetical protein
MRTLAGGWYLGNVAIAHSTMLTARMIVPARLTKSIARWPTAMARARGCGIR